MANFDPRQARDKNGMWTSGSPYSMTAKNARIAKMMGINAKLRIQDEIITRKQQLDSKAMRGEIDLLERNSEMAYSKSKFWDRNLAIDSPTAKQSIQIAKGTTPKATTAEWANRNKGTATILSRQVKGDARWGKASQVTLQDPKRLISVQKDQGKVLYTPAKGNKSAIAMGVKAAKGGYSPAGKSLHSGAVMTAKNFGAKIEKPGGKDQRPISSTSRFINPSNQKSKYPRKGK